MPPAAERLTGGKRDYRTAGGAAGGALELVLYELRKLVP